MKIVKDKITIFPEENWIEFDSMINIRSSAGNMGRYVNNPEIRKKSYL